MPSPFPGMDPWLEAPTRFPDIHDGLIFLIREAVNAVLPPPYFARAATRVYAEDVEHRQPDVSLVDPDGSAPDTGAALTVFEQAGLLLVEPEGDPVEEKYLEVRSGDGERLVTAVEVLSPANKGYGKGWEAYQEKQEEYRAGRVAVVEIDLLRAGRHVTAVPLGRLRAAAPGYTYHVCVTGPATGGRHAIAAIRLADRLPRILVPLDPGVPPVPVDLQPLLDRCYDTGLYARQLKYDRPPDPPLTPEQQAWAEGVLRTKGLLT
ncbi:MAG: DUF4058 family protein [Gemmataceae bacterium]